MKTINEIRALFPALQREIYGKPLVYLDNAATSQKTIEVIELLNSMNSGINANVHRAMYTLADEATQLYEAARDSVREFINANEREEIIFTSGATASINLVAERFCNKFLKEGDEVVVSEDSHHSNIVPWQLACIKHKAILKVIPVNDNGEWNLDNLDSIISNKVRIVAVPHISNVLGIINPIERVIEIAHKKGIPVLIDGAQGIVHCNVDVKSLDCDFYLFSTNKLYGATGSGVLYGKREWLDNLPPYMGGGDMVDTVTFEKTTYAELPLKFEAGTPNFIGAASLKPAIKFIKSCREGELGEAVRVEEDKIIEYMLSELSKIDGVKMYGVVEGMSKEFGNGGRGVKIPLFSISVDGCNPGDLAQILDKMGIAVRSGMMCAEPLMTRFGITSMLRASFAPYNTLEEAHYFIASLKRAINMVK